MTTNSFLEGRYINPQELKSYEDSVNAYRDIIITTKDVCDMTGLTEEDISSLKR